MNNKRGRTREIDKRRLSGSCVKDGTVPLVHPGAVSPRGHGLMMPTAGVTCYRQDPGLPVSCQSQEGCEIPAVHQAALGRRHTPSETPLNG